MLGSDLSVSINNFCNTHECIVDRSGVVPVHWLCDSLDKMVCLFVWYGFEFDNIWQKTISKVPNFLFLWKNQIIDRRKESFWRHHDFYFMISLWCWELFGCDNNWSSKIDDSQKERFSFSLFKEWVNLLQYFCWEFDKVFFSTLTNVAETFD